MTPTADTQVNGGAGAPKSAKPGQAQAKAKKRSAAPAKRRASRSSRRPSTLVGKAADFIAQSREPVGNAYQWASKAASRALPEAARRLPSQSKIQSIMEERPLVLGAIGLGIGALIGVMLPNALASGKPAARRPTRKR
jgi:hypothetical protein